MDAWNGWYHVTGSTYGTWLPGDPRGWRSRWHREHVDGDYKDPPPKDKFKALHERSKRHLKRPPVHFDVHQRRIAGQALVAKLSELGREVLVASMDSVHFHILARFADGLVRRPVGQAKTARHGLGAKMPPTAHRRALTPGERFPLHSGPRGEGRVGVDVQGRSVLDWTGGWRKTIICARFPWNKAHG